MVYKDSGGNVFFLLQSSSCKKFKLVFISKYKCDCNEGKGQWETGAEEVKEKSGEKMLLISFFMRMILSCLVQFTSYPQLKASYLYHL